MTKAEFLRALAGELSRLPETERREHLDYYSELIDDMMEEDGLSEQEAVDRLDDVYAIAADILRQRAPEGGAKPAAPGKKRGVLIAAVSAAAVLLVAAGIFALTRRGAAEAPDSHEPSPAPTEGWEQFWSGFDDMMEGAAGIVDGALDSAADIAGGLTEGAADIANEVIEGLLDGADGVFAGHDWDNEFSESGEYAVSAEGVSSIDIAWIAGGVDITPYDGDVISFRETALDSIPDYEALRYGVEDGTLYIQYCRSGANDLPDKKLTLLLPEELARGLDGLNVFAVSAALDIRSVMADTVRLATISGDVYYTGTASEMSVSTVSGDVTEHFAVTPERLAADTVSGSVLFSLPDEDWTLDFTTVSGALDSQFYRADSASGGGGDKVIDVSTTSGNLSLRRSYETVPG